MFGDDRDARFVPCEALDVDGSVVVPWDEAVQRNVDLPALPLFPAARVTLDVPLVLPPGVDVEVARAADGRVVGRIVRRREEVRAAAHVSASWVAGTELLMKIVVTVENLTDWGAPGVTRDEVVRHSLVAVHTILAVDDGEFVSLLDPDEHAREAVAGCTNDGVFPVLVGAPGATDLVLASPIILYDYPAIAPESQGDLYDATEIDEILALRVLTLTDAEKEAARATDARAAAIIDRCDDMEPDAWERLHGTFRSFESMGLASPYGEPGAPEAPGPEDAEPGAAEPVPWWDPGVDGAVDPSTDTVHVGDVTIGKGSAVRLRPSRRADAQDLFLAGMTATVAGVFRDVDGNDHVAVVLDADPAAAELEWQGRYLYFAPDELEPVDQESRPDAEAIR